MNEIYKRRSIRKFKNKAIEKSVISEVIRAGMNAPSAGNEQPWEFLIIDDHSILDEIPMVHPYAAMTKQAPLAIIICGDRNLFNHGDYWIQDCSAATQNILLSITEHNLGAVWLGVYPMEERVKGIRELLNLPENIIPFSIIPVGYPMEEKKPNNRFDEDRIHYNKW